MKDDNNDNDNDNNYNEKKNEINNGDTVTENSNLITSALLIPDTYSKEKCEKNEKTDKIQPIPMMKNSHPENTNAILKMSKLIPNASLEYKKKTSKSSLERPDISPLSSIPLWNSRRKTCLSGRNAPIRSSLLKFLATRPEYEIY